MKYLQMMENVLPYNIQIIFNSCIFLKSRGNYKIQGLILVYSLHKPGVYFIGLAMYKYKTLKKNSLNIQDTFYVTGIFIRY